MKYFFKFFLSFLKLMSEIVLSFYLWSNSFIWTHVPVNNGHHQRSTYKLKVFWPLKVFINSCRLNHVWRKKALLLLMLLLLLIALLLVLLLFLLVLLLLLQVAFLMQQVRFKKIYILPRKFFIEIVFFWNKTVWLENLNSERLGQ